MPPKSYTEDDMANAIHDIQDNGLGRNVAAKKHGVPPSTITDRLSGKHASKQDPEAQPSNSLLSDTQQRRIISWILRQERLGHAPSQSVVQGIVASITGMKVGGHWVDRFIKRHPELAPRLGVELDSLVVGTAATRKALIKSDQSRWWSTMIEAITANGDALDPGIIFKGKDLQSQWFLEEFKRICPHWRYITSPNGWTSNDLGVKYLEQVFVPQMNTRRNDDSEAILLILDGHFSHTTDEFITICFQNNIFCCYLPAHCSHGLQPLDNGVFNAVKAYYRDTLDTWQSLTDSSPVDKINFIRILAQARERGMTPKNIKSAFRTTGNWPISRIKALTYPEIKPDKEKRRAESEELEDDDTIKSARDIMDLAGANASASERYRFRRISRAFDEKEAEIAIRDGRILELEAQVERLTKKKRRAIPNPNKKFMELGEILGENNEDEDAVIEEDRPEEQVEDEIAVAVEEDSKDCEDEDEPPPEVRTRSGRASKMVKRYGD